MILQMESNTTTCSVRLPRNPIPTSPRVTVIVPVRNEQRYIEQFLEGLCRQDFPVEQMEILIADGMSNDSTVEIARTFSDRLPGLKVLVNPAKEKAPALNMCIPKATGDVILVMDCHTRYPSNYISGLIKCLRDTGADYVGGRVEAAPGADTYIAKVISLAMAHPFGVGAGTFRTSKRSGEGLAPFGCYRRELPFYIGGYNERLPRTHDDEFMARIMRIGGKCWVCGDICSVYFTRPTIRTMLKNMFYNGCYHIATFLELPGHFFLRHYVPFGFVTCLVAAILLTKMTPLGWVVLTAVAGPYALLDLASSIHVACKSGFRYLPGMLVLFPLMHITYGIGTWWGIIAYGIFKMHRRGGKKTGQELIEMKRNGSNDER